MKAVTVKALADTVRKLATDNPSNVYYQTPGKPCLYYDGECSNGSIGCIVGQALTALDCPVGTAKEDTAVTRQECFSDRWTEQTARNLQWVTIVQERQDVGDTWSEAVRVADEVVVRRYLDAPSDD